MVTDERKPQIKAALVFKGGGMKGAALAGALKAARAHCSVVAAGGSSAGALVALMAALRLKDDFVRQELVGLSTDALLPDGKFAELSSLLQEVGRLIERLKRRKGPVGVAGTLFWAYFRQRLKRVIEPAQVIVDNLGLASRNGLRKLVRGWIVEANRGRDDGAFANPDELTFTQLSKATGIDLRVVVSELEGRRAYVVGTQSTPDFRVIDWVATSAAFPLVFEPMRSADRTFTDGGLASNLPAFLFQELVESHAIPTFAFDLLPDVKSSPSAAAPSICGYLSSLLGTALDAHEQVLIANLRGVFTIPLEIPATIGTLDFDLSEERKKALYETGSSHAAQFFQRLPHMSNLTLHAEPLKEFLQDMYGKRELVETILDALIDQLEMATSGSLRASIMVETGRHAKDLNHSTRIVAYTSGIDDADPEAHREVRHDWGVSGVAHTTGKIHAQDFTETDDPPARGVKSMVSVPIFARVGGRVIATLNVDSTVSLDDWVGPVDVLQRGGAVVDILALWALVFSEVLQPWRRDVLKKAQSQAGSDQA